LKVLEIITRSTEFLARKGVDSPRLQVELMLAHILQLPRLKLYLNFDRVLETSQLDQLRAMVKRRGEREPLQHILGSAWFCGLEFAVNPNVLIPRPETETLAEQACAYLGLLARAEPERHLWVADVGTGSGCLAVAIASKFDQVDITGLDVSPEALEVARTNIERHRVTNRVKLRQSDLLASASDGRFDLIVSNPPYIPTPTLADLQPEVRDHDPRLALDGGTDGLQFYRRLAAEAPAYMTSDATLMAEFGDDQQDAITAIFQETAWRVEKLVPDLAAKPRIIVARRPRT
jgi:release factor glutamine methyltransferase